MELTEKDFDGELRSKMWHELVARDTAATDADAFAARIDAERLDAADQEWRRHDRVRLVELRELDEIIERVKGLNPAIVPVEGWDLGEILARLEGLREVVAGEWVQSPRAMHAQRRGAKGQAA